MMEMTSWILVPLITCGMCGVGSLGLNPDMRSWVLETNMLPMDNQTGRQEIDFRKMAAVGNGHVATVVYSPIVYMNGLYNGPVGWTHRAAIQSVHDVRISVEGAEVTRHYALDMWTAVFTETIYTDSLEIKHHTYAHQRHVQLLVTNIHVTRLNAGNEAVTLIIQGSEMNSTVDLIINETAEVVDISGCPTECRKTYGHTQVTETETAEIGQAHIYWTDIPARLHLSPNDVEQDWVFVSSYDAVDSKAKRAFQKALQLLTSTPDLLLKTHEDAWADKWNSGRIDVKGDLDLDTIIHSSLYYILMSLPSTQPEMPLEQFYGLSPGSLARGANWTDYQGHVFWDMESWMYPPILVLFPDLARDMLSYRIYGGEGAAAKAAEHGFDGWQYPWESAFTGYEMTPLICVPCRENEQHVTGDIAFAARQYWSVTRDEKWLRQDGGSNLIVQTATFWASRVERNAEEDRYEISGVMPPDERAESVNNSVYTNYVAKLNLELGRYVDCLAELDLPKSQTDRWQEVADKLYIVYNETAKHHPEYEGYDDITTAYNNDQTVKQADVVMLGFPLGYEMPDEVRRNDLLLYSDKGDPNGPAMTWSMFAINWLDLGELEMAADNFNKSYALYRRLPFNTWTEAQTGMGAANFITGMGGFLQAVIFGYAGMRLELEALTFNPRLPPKTHAMRVTGIDYLNATIDIDITANKVLVVLRRESEEFPLQLRMREGGTTWRLRAGMELSLPQGPFEISSLRFTECPMPEGSSCPEISTTERSTVGLVSVPANVSIVLVSQTDGAKCNDFITCSDRVREHLIIDDTINFYLGGDGRAYLGATVTSPPGILKIALLGDYTSEGMSLEQEAILKKILKCGMEAQSLREDYRLTFNAQAPSECRSPPCSGNSLHCQLKAFSRFMESAPSSLEPHCVAAGTANPGKTTPAAL